MIRSAAARYFLLARRRWQHYEFRAMEYDLASIHEILPVAEHVAPAARSAERGGIVNTARHGARNIQIQPTIRKRIGSHIQDAHNVRSFLYRGAAIEHQAFATQHEAILGICNLV